MSTRRDKDFLSVKEVSELLDLTERSVYKLIKTTDIPFKKVLNKWRIRRDQLDNWWVNWEGEDDE